MRTLLRRGKTVVSDPSDHEKVRHMKKALTGNGYKWSFEIPSHDSTQGEGVYPVCIPYVAGVLECPQHMFTTLRSQLVSTKDKTTLEKHCGLVYKVECGVCHKQYVGEIERTLGRAQMCPILGANGTYILPIAPRLKNLGVSWPVKTLL